MTASLMQSLSLSTPRTAPVPPLVAVLAARDAAALAQVYDEHRAALCSFCQRLLGDRSAAEDLTHDVFLRLPDLIHKLEPGRSLRAFLLAVAANHAKHYQRSAARRRKLAERFVQEPSGAAAQPDQVAEQRWAQGRIALALQRLPPEQQAAFVLAELEGEDAASIARRLSIPEATARTRLFHARRKLRVILSAWGLVAVFVASAAFAANQPAVRQAVVARLQEWFGRAQPVPPSPSKRSAPRSNSAPPSATSAESPAASPPSAKAPPVSLEALPLLDAPRAPRAQAARSPQTLGASSPTASSPELDSYRAAHRSHFDGADPAAALLAWDRYLADFPASSFATDARFNRALCLVRLGQTARARSVLEPFASAPPGSYRQREAASLLEGLGQTQTGASE